MKRGVFLKLFAVVLLCIVALVGVCEAVLKEVSGGIVRLHVIANSDSPQDQAVKLLVRDEVLRVSRELSGGAVMGLSFAELHQDLLTDAANHVLEENNCDYTCRIETGNFSFPTRKYESLTLPAGNYDAVRIILGGGNGQNWWCVMYPPLCFTEHAAGALSSEQQAQLSNAMGEAGYRLVSDESIVLEPAFKALEIWQSIKKRLARGN